MTTTDHHGTWTDPEGGRVVDVLDEGGDWVKLSISTRDPDTGELFVPAEDGYTIGLGAYLTRSDALELGLELVKAGCRE